MWVDGFWSVNFWTTDFWGVGEPLVARGRRKSVMWKLQTAIDERLQSSPTFTALVGDRVYSLGTVPKTPRAPYVELGDSTERASNMFALGGSTNEEVLTIVSPRAKGKPGVGEILAAIVDAFEKQPLYIQGQRAAHGVRVELVTIFPDPDEANLRGVCRLTVLSWGQ